MSDVAVEVVHKLLRNIIWPQCARFHDPNPVVNAVAEAVPFDALTADLTARLASAEGAVKEERAMWVRMSAEMEAKLQPWWQAAHDAVIADNNYGWMMMFDEAIYQMKRHYEGLADERDALKAAVEQARRETASDPDNRWCRNATIILNAARRTSAAGGRRE